MGIFQVLEVISMLTGIACVFFQTQEKIIAWPFGIVSVTLAVFVFRNEMLYSDFILHIIYIALSAYGWWVWSQRLKNKEDKGEANGPIKAMNLQLENPLCRLFGLAGASLCNEKKVTCFVAMVLL